MSKAAAVSALSKRESMEAIAGVLGKVRGKGVRLWSEGGQLRYKAPKGALTQEDIAQLRAFGPQITDLLGNAVADPELGSRCHRAPLTSSQLTHWHVYQLARRTAIRQIASATRIQGRLDSAALRRSLAEITRRHEALRTRIVVVEGAPAQEILAPGGFELPFDDLVTLSEEQRTREVQRLIDRQILEPIEVAVGPLFGARLLRTREDEHVLILVMEHMISDAFSLGILLREICDAYSQALKGHTYALPQIAVQLADYASWQRSKQARWMEANGAHWKERLTECQRLVFPEDEIPPLEARSGWGTVPIKIEGRLKREINEWCRSRGTTLPMTMFTAFAAVMLRWCNASRAIIQYQTDGRMSPDVENTIGYLASSLYLRVELRDDDSFLEFMKRLTLEYCGAYERPDFCWVEPDGKGPEFTRSAWFNWVPQVPDIEVLDAADSENAITFSQLTFEHPMLKRIDRDNDPVLLLYDSSDEVAGDFLFPQKRFAVDSIEKLKRNFLILMHGLIEKPEGRVKDVVLLG